MEQEKAAIKAHPWQHPEHLGSNSTLTSWTFLVLLCPIHQLPSQCLRKLNIPKSIACISPPSVLCYWLWSPLLLSQSSLLQIRNHHQWTGVRGMICLQVSPAFVLVLENWPTEELPISRSLRLDGCPLASAMLIWYGYGCTEGVRVVMTVDAIERRFDASY